MSVIADLAVLQDHDALIRELEQHVKDIPLRKAEELERLKVEEAALELARDAVRSVKSAIQLAEMDIQSRHEAILKLKQQQGLLKTNKEFAAMNAEIRTAEQALQNSEYDLAAHRGRLDPAELAERECEAKHAAAREGVESYVRELDERFAEAESRLTVAREQRVALREPLDVGSARRYLMYYERLSRNRWPVLVQIVDGICSGCHMTLPPSKLQAARRGTDLVTCDYCGRLVY